jgi:hypothetical protein
MFLLMDAIDLCDRLILIMVSNRKPSPSKIAILSAASLEIKSQKSFERNTNWV